MMNKELWLIRGRSPVLWTVPFWVVWVEENRAHLMYAVPLSGKQIRDISPTISQHGKSIGFGRWSMHRKFLEPLAELLPQGTDPDNVFSWHLPHVADKTENLTPERVDVNEFVATLFLKGVGKSREEVHWWYSQFCNHMADTLINREKPVDLMFIKLHQVPYRRNYMHVLMSRFPKFGRVLAYARGETRDLRCHMSGFYDEMLSLDLLALNKKEGWCYKYVEVEHTPKWFKTIRTVERARLSLLGTAKYAASLLGQLRSRITASVQLYSLWCADIARPSATDVQCGHTGEFRLAPHKPPAPNPKFGDGAVYVPVVVSNKLPLYTAPRALEHLYEADQFLPGMPDVQSGAHDVRNGGRKLLQPDLPTNGTSGVLVQASG